MTDRETLSVSRIIVREIGSEAERRGCNAEAVGSSPASPDEVIPMDEERKEIREIVLKTPEAMENILWEDGYPVGTIAHTEDNKYCWVWDGMCWEEC